MPIYLCRWADGFTAVEAANKEEAVVLLDEVGDASQSMLTECPNFMVNFRLSQQVTDTDDPLPSFELEDFSESTVSLLWDKLYPFYHGVCLGVENAPEEEKVKQLNHALTAERQRAY